MVLPKSDCRSPSYEGMRVTAKENGQLMRFTEISSIQGIEGFTFSCSFEVVSEILILLSAKVSVSCDSVISMVSDFLTDTLSDIGGDFPLS